MNIFLYAHVLCTIIMLLMQLMLAEKVQLVVVVAVAALDTNNHHRQHQHHQCSHHQHLSSQTSSSLSSLRKHPPSHTSSSSISNIMSAKFKGLWMQQDDCEEKDMDHNYNIREEEENEEKGIIGTNNTNSNRNNTLASINTSINSTNIKDTRDKIKGFLLKQQKQKQTDINTNNNNNNNDVVVVDEEEEIIKEINSSKIKTLLNKKFSSSSKKMKYKIKNFLRQQNKDNKDNNDNDNHNNKEEIEDVKINKNSVGTAMRGRRKNTESSNTNTSLEEDDDDGYISSQGIYNLLSEIKDKFNTDEVTDRITTKLLSAESAIAVRTIRDIIKQFPEHGVVDVFANYPTKDVVISILALSRLQRIVYTKAVTTTNNQNQFQLLKNKNENINTDFINLAFKTSNSNSASSEIIDYELLADLAHYSVFAHAAYGWKMGLLSGKLHAGDLATLLRKTGIQRRHVIATNWKSQTHLPAYFLVRDVERKKIVLCIRGTLSAKDILTDLCCTAEDFLSLEEEIQGEKVQSSDDFDLFRMNFRTKYRARAHQGMVSAARGVSNMTRTLISSELAANPEYNLVIVGHSLGGGVAAVLASLWRDTFMGLTVYAYGCPCVAPLDVHPTINESIISVVGEGDPFSSLSLGHLADVSFALSQLCEDHDLRSEILNRTKSNVDEMSEKDILWCDRTLESLQSPSSDNKTEKFYPPGRILHMRGNLFGSNINEVTLTEVRPEQVFRNLKIHPRMFDLSLHIPHRYEILLSRIWSSVSKNK